MWSSGKRITLILSVREWKGGGSLRDGLLKEFRSSADLESE
jgi:hypothetical protein